VNPGAKPTITSLNPSSVAAGSPGFTLNIMGTNYTVSSTVQVNGVTRASQFINNTQINVAITASDVFTAGNISIMVTNSGNVQSNTATLTVTDSTPTITSINPSTVFATSPAFTLNVFGTNFEVDSVLELNKVPNPSQLISKTQINVNITAEDLAVPLSIEITVTNKNIFTSNSVDLVILPFPAPKITGLNPLNVAVGGPDFTLQVSGMNFLNNSTATVGGVARALTYVSGTQVNTAVKAADIASVGPVQVAITNPAPGGGTDSSLLFVVNPNPVPVITQLNPSSVAAGSAGFTLTITGTGFVNTSVVTVNGSQFTSIPSGSTQLQISIAASDIQNPGNQNIVVTNPGPGGGASNTAILSVVSAADVAPVPMILNLHPSATSIGLGPDSFTLFIVGTGFVPTSVASIGGTVLPTTFVNPMNLTVPFPAADHAVAGQYPVVVTNPAPGGGTSNTLTVVVNPAIFLGNNEVVSISPTNVAPGSTAFTLAVTTTVANPSGGIPSAVVQINGQSRVTTFPPNPPLFLVDGAILASDVTQPGIAEIRLFFDASSLNGPGVSDFAPLVIAATGSPLPQLTSLNPNGVTAGGPAFTLEVDGTNFVPGTTVGVNGFPRPTMFVNSTTLHATILAEDIATPGSILVNAVTPPPGGGTSNAQSMPVFAPPGVITASISGAFTASLEGGLGTGTISEGSSATSASKTAGKTTARLNFVADGAGTVTSGTLEQTNQGTIQSSVDIAGSTITTDANWPGRVIIHLSSHGALLAFGDLTAYLDPSGNGFIMAGTPTKPLPLLGLGLIGRQADGPN
jgi:hypothetical protein